MNTIGLNITVVVETTMTPLEAKAFFEQILRDYEGTEHKTIVCHAVPLED